LAVCRIARSVSSRYVVVTHVTNVGDACSTNIDH
jgi:hypothetical protein